MIRRGGDCCRTISSMRPWAARCVVGFRGGCMIVPTMTPYSIMYRSHLEVAGLLPSRDWRAHWPTVWRGKRRLKAQKETEQRGCCVGEDFGEYQY